MKKITLFLILLVCFSLPMIVGADNKAPISHEGHGEPILTIYTCPMHSEIRETEPGLCPICEMSLIPTTATEQDRQAAEKKEVPKAAEIEEHRHMSEPEPISSPTDPEKTIYTCAMHPQIRSPQPGSCPICGMDLVPVKPMAKLPPSQVPGFATIQITPQQQWLIGVKTTTAKKQNIARRLRTFGTVAFDPKLYVAQKEYLEAYKVARASSSRSFLESARRKLILLGMTEKQIKDLEEHGKVDESLFLTEGTGKAWIYSVIYESERPLLRPGLKIEARTVGHPQMEYMGRVDAIIPVVDPMNRTIQVRSEVIDPQGILRPDMFVNVYIEIPLGEAITVPKSAVLQTGLRNIMLIAKGDGIFEAREVRLGNQSDDAIQIISGVNEGEEVVTSANFLLDSESQLRGAFEGAMGGHQHGQ